MYMKESFYKIAGKTVLIESDFDLTESKFTQPFKTEKTSAPDIICTARAVDKLERNDKADIKSDCDIAVYQAGNKIYTDSYLHDGKTIYARAAADVTGNEIKLDVLSSYMPFASDSERVMLSMNLYFALLKRGAASLHSASIEHGGKAILFTAASNTGKSTQAALWEKCRGARILNGDKNCVTVTDGAVFAHGIPFCGTSGITNNYTMPLCAVVVLKQAKENSVRSLRGVEALTALIKNSHGYTAISETMLMLTDVYTGVLKSVPVLELSCTPDERAVEELEKSLVR